MSNSLVSESNGSEGGKNRLVMALAIAATAILLMLVASGAYAKADPADPTALLTTFVEWVKQFANVAFIVIVIICFLVAAGAAVTALARFAGGRQDWGSMAVVFLIAILASVFVVGLATDGKKAVEELAVE